RGDAAGGRRQRLAGPQVPPRRSGRAHGRAAQPRGACGGRGTPLLLHRPDPEGPRDDGRLRAAPDRAGLMAVDPFELRLLGDSGVRVTRLGLGTAPLGGWPRAVAPEDGVATVRRAWEAGLR